MLDIAPMVPYVIVLLALPLLAQWRSGIVAALIVTACALGFAVLTHRYLVDHGFLPIVLSGPPAEHPKAKIWQTSIAAIERDMDWLFMPALAALTGRCSVGAVVGRAYGCGGRLRAMVLGWQGPGAEALVVRTLRHPGRCCRANRAGAGFWEQYMQD